MVKDLFTNLVFQRAHPLLESIAKIGRMKIGRKRLKNTSRYLFDYLVRRSWRADPLSPSLGCRAFSLADHRDWRPLIRPADFRHQPIVKHDPDMATCARVRVGEEKVHGVQSCRRILQIIFGVVQKTHQIIAPSAETLLLPYSRFMPVSPIGCTNSLPFRGTRLRRKALHYLLIVFLAWKHHLVFETKWGDSLFCSTSRQTVFRRSGFRNYLYFFATHKCN